MIYISSCQAPEGTAIPGLSKFRAHGSLDHPDDANICCPIEQVWFAYCTLGGGGGGGRQWHKQLANRSALPNSEFSDPVLMVWNQLWQEYLHLWKLANSVYKDPFLNPTQSWLVNI